MGFGDFLKKHVVDLGGDEGNGTPQAKTAPNPAVAKQPLNWQTTAGSSPVIQQDPGFDPEMVSQLQAVVLRRATPYTALVEASNRLSGIINDEATRFKAAYASVNGGGARTIASISQAIELHCGDLEMEGKRFEQAMSAQMQERVGKAKEAADAKRAEATRLANRIEDLQRQIADAQAAGSEAVTEAASLDAAANAALDEINAVEQRFKQSVEIVKTDLVNKRAYLSTVLV